MAGRLDRKNIIVVGGASGMGAAQVSRFVAEGARVTVADIDAVRVAQTASEAGKAACFVALDVRDEAAWKAAVASAEEFFGKPCDGLINNAGFLVEEGIETTSLESYNRQIAVMQTAVFLGMKSVAPSLRRAGGGSIVSIASTAGLVGYATHSATRPPSSRCAA